MSLFGQALRMNKHKWEGKRQKEMWATGKKSMRIEANYAEFISTLTKYNGYCFILSKIVVKMLLQFQINYRNSLLCTQATHRNVM